MDIKCDCGGTLKPARLTSFDLTEYLGIKVTAGEARGLRCNRCGWETLSGETIELAQHTVAAMILNLDERLRGELTHYLRKYLGLTQQELATRMGVTRKTVNQWESDGPISPQHDLILRTLVYAQLSDVVRPRASTLDHVRTAPPRARAHRLTVHSLGRAA